MDREVYSLAKGTKVRREDFGLLFYTMSGPRLYFVRCKELFGPEFFNGKCTLDEWFSRSKPKAEQLSKVIRGQLEQVLESLKHKGVIVGRKSA